MERLQSLQKLQAKEQKKVTIEKHSGSVQPVERYSPERDRLIPADENNWMYLAMFFDTLEDAAAYRKEKTT